MISIEEALELVLAHLPAKRVEEIDFQFSLGRVLAEHVIATTNIPPFHRSAMDGFALRAADARNTPTSLKYVGEIRAGGGLALRIGPGEAAGIMTGAPVPEGADAVQIVELTERSEDGRQVVIK